MNRDYKLWEQIDELVWITKESRSLFMVCKKTLLHLFPYDFIWIERFGGELTNYGNKLGELVWINLFGNALKFKLLFSLLLLLLLFGIFQMHLICGYLTFLLKFP